MRKDMVVDATGMTNETEDGFYLVFADYDNVDYEVVYKDVMVLLRQEKLDCVVVLVNEEHKAYNEDGVEMLFGHYNLVTFDKLPFGRCERIIDRLCCDRDFKEHIWYYPQRNRVIRISDKRINGKQIKPAPAVKQVFYNDKMRHEHSEPHIRLMQKVFEGLDLIDKALRRLDGLSQVQMVSYKTRKKNIKKRG